jgi:hypothetical protein
MTGLVMQQISQVASIQRNTTNVVRKKNKMKKNTNDEISNSRQQQEKERERENHSRHYTVKSRHKR